MPFSGIFFKGILILPQMSATNSALQGQEVFAPIPALSHEALETAAGSCVPPQMTTSPGSRMMWGKH